VGVKQSICCRHLTQGIHDKQLTNTTYEGRICELAYSSIDDKQLTDITQATIFPIFQFDYSGKNEYYSCKSQSRYINQGELNICVTVLLKIV
jgi:hypothetical protein